MFLVLLGTAAGLTYYLLRTTHGSGVLTRFAIFRFLGSSDFTIHHLEGNLSHGLSLYGIDVPSVARLLPGGSLHVERAVLVPLSLHTLKGLNVEMQGMQASRTPVAPEITVARIEGNLVDGVTIHELHLREPTRFPQGSALDIEQLTTGVPIDLQHLRTIHNGKLRLPESEPLLFYGSQKGGQIDFRVYARYLDVRDVLSVVSSGQTEGRVKGSLHEVDVTAGGSIRSLALTGQFHLAWLSRDEFSIAECPVTFALTLKGLPGEPAVYGEIALRGGQAASRQTTVTLQPGKIMFVGDPLQPVFDVRGSSTVEGTKIHIALQGTRERPELKLTSDPPIAQEVLLIMLATGKRWKGAQEAFAHGVISSDLATDFIDYFIFGGFGSQLANRFGLPELALTYDVQTKRVGVQTSIADRVQVGIEVEPSSIEQETEPRETIGQGPPIPYKVGAEVKVTENTSVQIEGEGVLRQPSAANTETGQPTGAGPDAQTEERVLLKVRRRF